MKPQRSNRFSNEGPAWTLFPAAKRILHATLNLVLAAGLLSFADIALAQRVYVQAGDETALIQAVELANVSEYVEVVIRPDPNGDNEFVFEGPYGSSGAALPELTGRLRIRFASELEEKVVFRTAENAFRDFRFMIVSGSGFLEWWPHTRKDQSNKVFVVPMEIFGFAALNASGGAVWALDMADVFFDGVKFKSNLAADNGGAVAATGSAQVTFARCEFLDNFSSGNGGAISIEDEATGFADKCRFGGGESSGRGCYIYVNSSGNDPISHAAAFIGYSVFSGSGEECYGPLVESPQGDIKFAGNSFSSGEPIFGEPSSIKALGNLFDSQGQQQLHRVASNKNLGTDAVCQGGSLQSLGYNISPDNSCGLNQPTDLPNTNPMVALDPDGNPVPQPASPAIDAGAVNSMVIGDDGLASLPCGYVDLVGTARPQDGNGDGVFECDIGAVEIAGAGDITDGHSGAFFNLDRDGEGTYVEILDDETAVVYTFTYRPDGSGPAWFIGVGRIEGNSIIIDELLRPIGTSFGSAFDPNDIEFTPIGGMSMVFPDCTAASPGGNVAYSGDFEVGYEGLITRATRLSNITGCGSESPSPKAGLSGSYFDPARDGEGIIVEWLTSGEVLVVFFTYDQDGNQMWLIGIGQPAGNTVTMDALYASTYTSWGSGFDPGEVTISNWGSFTLTWSQCNAVSFQYNSTVPGFGSATRNYTRLSKLQNTDCPAF